MRILFLDLARQCGWAYGSSTAKPKSWSAPLGSPGELIGLQCGELAKQLVALKRDHGVPDLVGIEHHLAPKAQPSQNIIISSLMLRGTVHAVMGGVYGCRIVEPHAAQIRAAVCGRANAGERSETKLMVLATVKMLGMLDKASSDDNRADAICGFLFCASTFAREWPGEFVLR